jgi:ATP-binding cassette subfamily F protein 3
MLTVNKVTKGFGPQVLFKEISLRLNKGERVGLVGPNGAGKTTLLSIILGELESDEGGIEFERGTRIGYLPQESAPVGEETVLELAAATTPELQKIYATFRENLDLDAPERVTATERFVELDGYALEAKAKQTLGGLAFRQEDLGKPARTLSGGWIMRAHLARLLVMEADLLILDEPTNHLDLETLGWFQEQLRRTAGAILTISHDRAFLNSICNHILEIRHKKLHRYSGDFDAYLIQKAEREAQHAAAYKNQQREIAHLEDFVRRFRAKATKATQAQARLKQLEKMERIEAPEAAEATLRFNFPQPPRSGQVIATLEAVEQAYGDHKVYSGLDFKVEKKERIVLVGPNGAGKSTLLKILADVTPIQSGQRTLGHNVTAGYFSQQRVEVLDLTRSVLEEALQRVENGLSDQDVRNLLGSFLFRGDAVHKKVKVLSGGEKSRLALVKLLLAPPNFLLLDEPTTHLDMSSIDALIQALDAYTGTLIFVSHDVHFIRAIANRTIHIHAGDLTHYAGGYDYYLNKSGASSEQQALIGGLHNARPGNATAGAPAPDKRSAKDKRRAAAAERQVAKAARREVELRVAALEKEILKLEEEQAEISQQLEDPETYGDSDKAKDLNIRSGRLQKRLTEKNYEWEIAAEELSDKLLEKDKSH